MEIAVMHGIGKRIQKYRVEAGITQEVLAEMVEISCNYLSAVEPEVKVPKLDTLIRIINALHLSADDILQDVVEESMKTRYTQLETKMQKLSKREQERILRVIDVLIEETEQ